MDAAVNLKEQPDVKELLYALESNGLKEEQKEVKSLVDYLEGMESLLGQMLGEMQAVRGELEKIQDRGIRATAARVADSAEGKMKEILGKVSMIGKNLVRSAKNAVAAFQEKGVDALRKAVSAMKIPNVLSAMKDMFQGGVDSMNRKAEKTGMLAEELHMARGHRKNIGRILTGRQAEEPMERAADRGILDKIQKVFLSCGKMYSSMERKTEKALKRTEEFCRRTERKPSVKSELKQIKAEKSEKRAIKPRGGQLMGTDIKTRRVHRDIKALDKTATAAERIRQSCVRTRDSTVQTKEHAAPVEYAEDRVTDGADTAVRKGVHHAAQQGGRIAGGVKEKYRASKEIKQRKSEVRGGQSDISSGENPTVSPPNGAGDCLPEE